MYAICVQGTAKIYRNGVQVLNNFNMTVKQGEIFSLLGQNGAGKSTLIKILTTYLKPDLGEITMLGKDIYRDAAAIRSNIACVAQQTSIDTHLSLEENMMFQGRLYKLPGNEARLRMKKLIEGLCLQPYCKYPLTEGFVRNESVVINTNESRSGIQNTAKLLINENIPFLGIEIVQPALEDVFLRFTAKNEQEECI